MLGDEPPLTGEEGEEEVVVPFEPEAPEPEPQAPAPVAPPQADAPQPEVPRISRCSAPFRVLRTLPGARPIPARNIPRREVRNERTRNLSNNA